MSSEHYQKILESIAILEQAMKNPPPEYTKRQIREKLEFAKRMKIIYEPKNEGSIKSW